MNIKYSDVGFFYYLQTSSIKENEGTMTLLWSVLLCVKSNLTTVLSALMPKPREMETKVVGVICNLRGFLSDSFIGECQQVDVPAKRRGEKNMGCSQPTP